MTKRIRSTARKDVASAAAAIVEAYRSAEPCAPVRTLLDPADVASGYAVQELNTRRWLEEGRRLAGRKIGLTSAAVQRQLGVDQPDYGMLWADAAIGDGGEVAVGAVLQPRVEAEVAFVLERALDMADPTAADLMRSIAYVVPALEIVGSRIVDWDITIVDTIADNASSGLFVLGGPARRLDGVDLAGCRMEMARDEQTASTGQGAACLGSPLTAAVWLAAKMAAIGQPLQAGDVIMSGALGPMVSAMSGSRFEARIEGLGSVSVNFAAVSLD